MVFDDFEKAFDAISRKLLWPILLKTGFAGMLFRRIRSMYNIVKAKLRCGSEYTDCINCTRDVKQGDVYSSVLFSIFVDDLALEIIMLRL